MASKTYILRELNKINRLYNEATQKGDGNLQRFYSKLALLELCGWIEQSMDDMIERPKKRLKKEENIKYLEKEIVKRNYSFTYVHFRRMLIQAIGLLKVERLEKKLNESKNNLLKSALGTLKKIRDAHAHTHIYGTTATFYAPSYSRRYFNAVYDGLEQIDKSLINILRDR